MCLSYITGIWSLPGHCGTTSDEPPKSLWWSVVVWALPLVFVLSVNFRVDFSPEIILTVILLLPLTLLIYFLGGTLKALSAKSLF